MVKNRESALPKLRVINVSVVRNSKTKYKIEFSLLQHLDYTNIEIMRDESDIETIIYQEI